MTLRKTKPSLIANTLLAFKVKGILVQIVMKADGSLIIKKLFLSTPFFLLFVDLSLSRIILSLLPEKLDLVEVEFMLYFFKDFVFFHQIEKDHGAGDFIVGVFLRKQNRNHARVVGVEIYS